MRERERQLLLQELLDVWAADIGSLFDFDDLKDLWDIALGLVTRTMVKGCIT